MTTWHKKHEDALTFGEKMADGVAKWMGSWKFIVLQTCFVALWMTLNVIGIIREWDPYPFILLNLLFSTQAAYAAPIIMMAQNRDVERDRVHAEQDYETNRKAKIEIEDLQKRLSRIENEKLDKIMEALERIEKR